MPNTQLIVLHKTLYRESDLIIGGISPDFGKLDLLQFRGAKISEKEFPVAGLFRELEVEFEENSASGSTLHRLKNAALLHDFDRIGDSVRNFKFANAAGSFLLKNCTAALPCPFTYDLMRQILFDLTLAEPKWTLTQSAVLFKLTFLYENGLLPESGNVQSDEFFEALIASGMEGETLPAADGEYYSKLNLWLDSILSINNLQK